MPEAFAYALPDAFDDLHAAPLLCAGIIGYRALRQADVTGGETVGLYGFGSSAHIALQIARHRGNRVFVATRGERHRELARRMGAAWVGDATDPPPEPLDRAVIFAPAGELIPAALEHVRWGGSVASAAIHMSAIPAMDYGRHLFGERTLRSTTASTRADGIELLREAAEAGVRTEVDAGALRRGARGTPRDQGGPRPGLGRARRAVTPPRAAEPSLFWRAIRRDAHRLTAGRPDGAARTRPAAGAAAAHFGILRAREPSSESSESSPKPVRSSDQRPTDRPHDLR